MIIEVRPTRALRRGRTRIVGAVVGVALLAAALVSVTELTGAVGVSQRDTVWPASCSAESPEPGARDLRCLAPATSVVHRSPGV